MIFNESGSGLGVIGTLMSLPPFFERLAIYDDGLRKRKSTTTITTWRRTPEMNASLNLNHASGGQWPPLFNPSPPFPPRQQQAFYIIYDSLYIPWICTILKLHACVYTYVIDKYIPCRIKRHALKHVTVYIYIGFKKIFMYIYSPFIVKQLIV